MPNGPITLDDLCLYKSGGFKTALLMWYHTPDDVARVREAGAEHIVVRLWDSEFAGADGRKYLPSFTDYAHRAVSTIRAFYSLGVRDFQMDNEPNITWPEHGQNEWSYQWWANLALPVIRSLTTGMQYRLGFAPMSLATEHGPNRWYSACRALMGRFDFIAAHAYWQAERHITSAQFGGFPFTVHQYAPDKPILVTEWASSISQTNPAPDRERREQIMVEQYPVWLAWARTQPYIEAAHCFLIGGTQDWYGFKLTERIVEAMRG